MKKYILLLLLTTSYFFSLCQMSIDLETSHICSHQKYFENYIANSQNIIQTQLLHDYDVNFYFLELSVENNSVDISGSVTYHARVVAEQTDTFAFELIDDLVIDSIIINEIKHLFLHTSNEVFVPLLTSMVQNEHFVAQIYYHGTPPTGGFFTGISTRYDSTWNKNVTWTLSEPFNARQWWPAKQVLTDKADSVWVFITTSNVNKVGSQGILTNITSMPNDKVRYEWKSRYPIDYYLISFAVAEYMEYSIYAHPAALLEDSLLIQNYIYDSPGCLDYYKTGIDRTVEFIDLFSDLFTLYPFHDEKYGHCLTTLSGGMEHQTMTTIGSFSFGLVAHELGHMWFGDNVTCATWSDIWINEGFATYADYLANEFILGQSTAINKMKSIHTSVLSEPDGSVYVPPDEITYDNMWRIFSGRLSYRKGAAIIHMIRFELQDDDLFFQVLQNFQEEFSDSTAIGVDFMTVLNETSGSDFTEFFDQWYFGEGYPIYYISWIQENNILQINSSQISSIPQVTPFFKMNLPYRLFFNDGTDTTITLYQSDHDMEFALPYEKLIDSILIDPENWVLKKVVYLNNIKEIKKILPFEIYPNPAHNQLSITAKEHNVYDLIISDLNGKDIIRARGDQQIMNIDISKLFPGAYIVIIRSDEKTFSRKIIKIN